MKLTVCEIVCIFTRLFLEFFKVGVDSCADNIFAFFVFICENKAFANENILGKMIFKFFGINVFAVACDDNVLASARNIVMTLFIDVTEVTCVEEAFAVDDFGSLFGIIILAEHYHIALDTDFTDTCYGIGVEDLCFTAGNGFTD